MSDSKVSQIDAAVKSDVKNDVKGDAKSDVKGDDATSKDRTKLTLKLPPRPADYDYYWYQDDDGTWRNEYDDQVRSTTFKHLEASWPRSLGQSQ